MASAITILRREFLSLFVSPIAPIVLFAFVLVNGVALRFLLGISDGEMEPVLISLFGGPAFWFLWLLVPPLVTMRSFAEEKRSGTFELLVTTGVSDGALVVGKFFAAWGFLLILWGSVLPFLLLLEVSGSLDWGVVASTYCGIGFTTALLASLGILASALTQNQLIAAILATVANLGVFLVNFFRAAYPSSAIEQRYFEYISPAYHFARDFSQGVVDLRTLVLYGSGTLWALFVATKVLERRRWQ